MTWTKIKPKDMENSDTWKPEANDTLEGEYTGVEQVGPNESNLYSLETEEGKIKVWGSTVLDGRFEEVKVGDRIKIEYLGKKKGQNNSYHDYDLWIDKD